MAFIKEENEDFRIEAVFSLKQEDNEEQTDPMKEECEVLNEMEEKHQYKIHQDFTTKEKSSASLSPKQTSWPNRGKITESRRLTCQQCGRSFNRKNNLSRHMTIHTDEKLYTCQQCGKRFSQKGDLHRHIRSHRGEKPYTCQLCGKRFSRKANLNRHTRIHNGEKPYDCKQCGKGFYRKASLIIHTEKHTGEKPFTCQECGKCFNQKYDLKKHFIIHTEKTHICQQCGKRFYRKADLNKHIQIHTGEKPCICKHCGRRFNQKGDLTRHIRVHKVKKRHSYQQCGKRVNQEHKHRSRIIHTGKHPYTGKQSGKTATQNGKRLNHMKTCTKDEFYTCVQRGESFKQKQCSNRIHAGDQPFTCRQCGKSCRYNPYVLLRFDSLTYCLGSL